jgi:hypothetical protein
VISFNANIEKQGLEGSLPCENYRAEGLKEQMLWAKVAKPATFLICGRPEEVLRGLDEEVALIKVRWGDRSKDLPVRSDSGPPMLWQLRIRR